MSQWCLYIVQVTCSPTMYTMAAIVYWVTRGLINITIFQLKSKSWCGTLLFSTLLTTKKIVQSLAFHIASETIQDKMSSCIYVISIFLHLQDDEKPTWIIMEGSVFQMIPGWTIIFNKMNIWVAIYYGILVTEAIPCGSGLVVLYFIRDTSTWIYSAT